MRRKVHARDFETKNVAEPGVQFGLWLAIALILASLTLMSGWMLAWARHAWTMSAEMGRRVYVMLEPAAAPAMETVSRVRLLAETAAVAPTRAPPTTFNAIWVAPPLSVYPAA